LCAFQASPRNKASQFNLTRQLNALCLFGDITYRNYSHLAFNLALDSCFHLF
jgi:hypothetical protein